MEDKYIGIIDSGFGGLSVLNELIKLMPKNNYIFYADSANSPFGKKTPNEIFEITKIMIERLISLNVKEIVIACGTISTTILNMLIKEYPSIDFIGTFPDFEQIFTKDLILNNNHISLDNNCLNINRKRKKMLILGTIATCKSKYLNSKVNDYKNFMDIYIEPAQELVSFVENDKINSKETNEYLENLLKQYYDTNYIVLGCTHFPFLKTQIKKYINDEIIILDGCKLAAKKAAKRAAFNNSNANIIRIIDTNINDFRKKMYNKLIKTINHQIIFNY